MRRPVALHRAVLGAACLLAPLLAAVAAGARDAAPPDVLRVGTSGDYAPFSEAVGDARRGFDVDVAVRFARDSGRRLEWVPFRWPELARDLAAGRFDVAMSGVTVRPERSLAGRFSLPVVETGAVLLVREATLARRRQATGAGEAGDPLDVLRDLDDASVRVAVNAGGHLERVTRAHFARAEVRAIPDNAAVPVALARGEVDVVVSDGLEAPHWLEGLAQVRALGPFTRDLKAYWLPADAADLAAELDAWLLAREADGSLGALRDRWFPAGARSPTADPLAGLLAASDERLALMPAVAEWKRDTGAAVVDPAREMRVVEAGWLAVRGAAGDGAAPPRAAVEAWYRAQIDAAVSVQRRVLAGPTPAGSARFDLETQLRPALLRIGERMARLLVACAQVPAGDRGPLRERVARALAAHRLPDARIDAIADALARIASTGRAP